MRALAALLVVVAVAIASARPPHHTDSGFRSPQAIEHAGPSVTVPFFLRRAIGGLFGRDGAPPVVPNDGAFLRDNAAHSVPTVTWIGHATMLVQMDHVTLLTDPTWSDRASPLSFAGPRRFVPPGLALAALPPIDFVLVSHSHYDHADLDTLKRLVNGRTQFFAPLRLGGVLRAAGIEPVVELDWWDTHRIGGVAVHCVPSRHWSQRGLFDRDETLWSGWVVAGPTRRFYFAGDTGYFDGFTEIGARLGPIDLAAIPIGAYEPAAMMRSMHLNPEEALQASVDMGAITTLGMHYGTFDLTDEPLDEPPRRFHADAARRGLDPARVWTLAIGETRRW